jgi:hypothetical protein
MNKIQAYWFNKMNEGAAIAEGLHQTTGYTYRVRQTFVGVCIEAYSKEQNKWVTAKVIR